ncbi:MAG: type II toxin-antitoxin system VapC family toxin [Bacteroidota bacterium]
MNKLLLDTNILIYSKDKSSQFHLRSQALLSAEFELYTTSKNLAEYYAVTTKGVSPLLTSEAALADLDEFSANFTVLFPNELSLDILKKLIKVHSPKGLVIHDFEIVAISLANDITRIATVNADDFKNIERIEVVSI